jgi:hypothetical protein
MTTSSPSSVGQIGGGSASSLTTSAIIAQDWMRPSGKLFYS